MQVIESKEADNYDIIPMYFDPTYILVLIGCRDLPDRICEDEFHIQQIIPE